MTVERDGRRPRAGRLPVSAVSSWPVWGMPRRVLAPVLLVELTALLLTVAPGVAGVLPRPTDLRTLAIVGLLGLAHTEVAVRVERQRRRVTEALHVDLTSVWTFAAALLLPPALAALLAVVLQVHIWRRAWYPRVPLFRQLFSIATVVLACLAAGGVARSFAPGAFGQPPIGLAELESIGLALLTYAVVNSALVAGAILLDAPQQDVAGAIGGWDENLLEIATLCLGALTAIGLTISPYLTGFVLPALLLLHRAVLVRHLQEAADTDVKTGLLNAAAWHGRAEDEIRRAGERDGPGAVLVIDLDHFKRINDRHGHVAGDAVLAAVADALRSEIREHDLVGRFGGEEFVVLLAGSPDDTETAFFLVAERIRRRIRELSIEFTTADGVLGISGLSVSIGGAVHPLDGHDVRTLLHVADTALYAAKRAGRDTVHIGLQLPDQRTRPDTMAPPAGEH
jgi:diguanylate cyclase (GGDEF)-like protein